MDCPICAERLNYLRHDFVVGHSSSRPIPIVHSNPIRITREVVFDENGDPDYRFNKETLKLYKVTPYFFLKTGTATS